MIEINALYNGTSAFDYDTDTAPQVGDNIDGYVVTAVRQLDPHWYEVDLENSN